MPATPSTRRPCRSSGGLAVVLVALGALATPEPGAAVRFAGRAFDAPAEIEVRELSDPAAEAAAAEAFAVLERAPQVLRALEDAAATGRPVALDEASRELVERAVGFCYWSEGGVGPLGGEIYRLIGLRAPVLALPTPDALDVAVSSARCERARFDREASTLTVAAGSRLDFFPFEVGWAVDRAVDRLRAHGATNFEVVVGAVRRGVGGGPNGAGWPAQPPTVPGLGAPLSPFLLRDRAVVAVTPKDSLIEIAGERVVPYLDQRTGRTAGGVAATMVVAELAVDAQALAYAMFALGPRDGTMLVGSLNPRPSIRWLLGGGEGPPVITDHNWGAVPRR
jgi:thiamine biosynthesis lipoprotein ApbE